MFPLLLICYVFIDTWGPVKCALQDPLIDSFILGGLSANIEKIPYQVHLKIGPSKACSASILSESWVLTAAHCVERYEIDSIKIRAGSNFRDNGGSIHLVSKKHVHPNYNGDQISDYDVAVLKVSTQLELSDTVKPISMISKTPASGTAVVVTGWGRIHPFKSQYSPQLRKVTLNIVDHDECYKDYQGLITARMLCAGVPEGGKGSCLGDSGGPLVANGKLAGVVSWGYICGLKDYPGVYSDVAVLKDWITSVTGIN